MDPGAKQWPRSGAHRYCRLLQSREQHVRGAIDYGVASDRIVDLRIFRTRAQRIRRRIVDIPGAWRIGRLLLDVNYRESTSG
jgi:hypothetical protein